MNDMQEKLYELIVKFDEKAQKYGVTYYLGGGSALGAIRHQGFLPWDDDVDLYITRKNYERLLEVRDDFFDDDFIFVAARDVYPRYRNPLVRCVDTHTTAITRARIADGTPKGEFVELFILDPLPQGEVEKDAWLTKKWLYTELLAPTYRTAGEKTERWTDEALYDAYLKRCEKEGVENVLTELEDEIFTIPEEEATEVALRWGLRNIIYDINWFKEPRYVPFEDIKLPVPTFAENVLRTDYGDSWMMIPQVDNQVQHIYADNLEIDYKEFAKNYEAYIDEDEIWAAYPARKEKMMSYFFAKKRTDYLKRKLKELEIVTSLKRKNLTEEQLKALADSGQWDELERIYRIWHGIQVDGFFWLREESIKISDRDMYYGLLPYVVKGGYSQARKILMWREKDMTLAENLKIMYDFVVAIRDTYIAIDNNDIDLAKKRLSDAMESEFPYRHLVYDIKGLKLTLMVNDVTEETLPEYAQFAEENANNGETIFLYANALHHLGKVEQAKKLAREAYDKTRNGIIRLKIEEMVR